VLPAANGPQKSGFIVDVLLILFIRREAAGARRGRMLLGFLEMSC
jgi:hypothetical protein